VSDTTARHDHAADRDARGQFIPGNRAPRRASFHVKSLSKTEAAWMRGKARGLQAAGFGHWARCLAYARRGVQARRVVAWSAGLDPDRAAEKWQLIDKAERYLCWLETRIGGAANDDGPRPLDPFRHESGNAD